jgi:hypothetical protein
MFAGFKQSNLIWHTETAGGSRTLLLWTVGFKDDRNGHEKFLKDLIVIYVSGGNLLRVSVNIWTTL